MGRKKKIDKKTFEVKKVVENQYEDAFILGGIFGLVGMFFMAILSIGLMEALIINEEIITSIILTTGLVPIFWGTLIHFIGRRVTYEAIEK